jgi:uncharacterized membrane protein
MIAVRLLGATMFTTGILTLWFMARSGSKERKSREESWASIMEVERTYEA